MDINKLMVIETAEQTIIKFKRKSVILFLTGTIGLAFLLFGLWVFELNILIVSTSVSLVSLLTIIRKWNGRTAFIIDHLNNQLIFPSNNQYEQTTGIYLSAISEITSETAGDGNVNYIFIEQPNQKPQLMLKLRKVTESQLNNLENWLESKLETRL
ncbi:MAG: hypothetical protein RIC06_09720 [Cyclobacteriaceae bacterium]